METKQRTVEEVILSLKKTLLRITNWDLPSTGKFWDKEKTRPTSYETEYGSNGARDYIRSLAKEILEETKNYSLQNDNGQEIEFAEWIARKEYSAMYQYEPYWAQPNEDQTRVSTSELFQLFLFKTQTKKY